MNIRVHVKKVDDLKDAISSGLIIVSDEVKEKMSKLFESTGGDILSALSSVIQAVEYDVAREEITDAQEAVKWISQSLYGLLSASLDKDRKEFASWMDTPAYERGHKEV